MNQFLKKYPVPIAGLILGLAAAGNLVQSYGGSYHMFFGIISSILFVLMLLKIIKYPKDIKESLNNPVVASVFPALSMAIMLLSVYLKPLSYGAASILWYIGIILHMLLILWFTKKFVLDFKLKQVFPSWFIVYVGIVAASVTGPAFKMIKAGQAAFWFGFVAYLILLPMIIYRVLKIKEMPESALPTLAIFAAPVSLLLAGYMNSFKVKNMVMVLFLMVLSIIMYFAVILMLFKLLRLKFYPSYSGFTFPVVISGIAMKLTNKFLIKSGSQVYSLRYLVKFQEFIGIIITLYVLIRYIYFLAVSDSHAVKDLSKNI